VEKFSLYFNLLVEKTREELRKVGSPEVWAITKFHEMFCDEIGALLVEHPIDEISENGGTHLTL
jgi:hypothetical protein